MKNFKQFLIIALSAISTQIFAQTDKETTAKILNDKNYVFSANSATPMANMDLNKVLSKMNGGQSAGRINLSGSQYDLTVTKDSVVAYLPYYGRSYVANPNTSEGGIKFKSKKFNYTSSKNKKGSYTIRIRTNDLTTENYDLTLSVSQNGYASLSVSSNNKQPITFDGYLEEPKAKKL